MNITKRFLTSCIILGIAVSGVAKSQDGSGFKLNKLRLESRADYDFHDYGQDGPENRHGFGGKYLNFLIGGDINEHFSFNYRQRILPTTGEQGFFDGTDYMYLTCRLNKNVSFSAGKQVVYIGGFEYDLAPIDVYFWSEFWNNIICYQIGASAEFTTNDGNHQFILQVANSPYSEKPLDNLYSYNAMWYGNMDFWKTMYSVNMLEYSPGSFINYIALGNRFDFGKVSFYIDYMNRYFDGQDGFFDDFTAIGEIKWNISDVVSVFGKGGYDVNKECGNSRFMGVPRDIFVAPGTEYYYYGLGFEIYPMKTSKDIRIHGFAARKNTDFDGTGNDINDWHFSLGLTWRIDFLKKFPKLAQ